MEHDIKWVGVEGGESILISSIIGVGLLKKVKTSSGKGQDIVEKTVYNFTIRLGTGGVVLKSEDFPSQDIASDIRAFLLR